MNYVTIIPLIFNKSSIIVIFFWFRETYQIQTKKLIEYGMIYGYDVDIESAGGHNIYKWHCDGDYNMIKKHLSEDLKIIWHIFNMIRHCEMIPMEYRYGDTISTT